MPKFAGIELRKYQEMFLLWRNGLNIRNVPSNAKDEMCRNMPGEHRV